MTIEDCRPITPEDEVDHEARKGVAVIEARLAAHEAHCAERYTAIDAHLHQLSKRWWSASVTLIFILFTSIGTLALLVLEKTGKVP